MIQLKKQTPLNQDRTTYNTTPVRRSILSLHEDLISRRELQRVLQGFGEREEQLQGTVGRLEAKNRELSVKVTAQQAAQHQCQRFRHLLSIKEQVIIAQQKEIQELKASLYQSFPAKSRQGKGMGVASYSTSSGQEDLSDVSKIDMVEEDSSEKENRGFETKRKICLKKGIKSSMAFRTNKPDGLAEEGQKLEIARLKAEIGRLKGTIEELQTQLLIAEIEMEHTSKDCEITAKRERRLHEAFTRFLRESSSRREEEGGLSQKCNMLEKHIHKLTDKLERAEQPHLSFQKFDVPPPITPHFSNAAFVFPNPKRTPSKLHSPPIDEIFEASCGLDMNTSEL